MNRLFVSIIVINKYKINIKKLTTKKKININNYASVFKVKTVDLVKLEDGWLV